MSKTEGCKFHEAIGQYATYCEVHNREKHECVEELLDKEVARRRKYQLMVKHIAVFVETPHPLKYERACGDCLCAKCGLAYFDHPKGSEDFLTLLCDGSQVKL